MTIRLSGDATSVTHAAVFAACHVTGTPSAPLTRTVVVSASSEPTCPDAWILSALRSSRSAVAGLINLSRRHVVTDTASANTAATYTARIAPKSRLIGHLGYKGNGFSGRAPAHAVAVAQRPVCLGLVGPVSFASQPKTVRGELRPIAATLNKSLKSRTPASVLARGPFFLR